MNVNNQTILHVKAGHLPPDDMLEFLLGKKPNAFGFTVQSLYEGKPDLAVVREDATNMSLSELKGLFVNAKDDPITVWLGKLKDGYDPEDIQPFLVRDSNDDAFISIFLEGDLVGNDVPIMHTEQANYVNGILIPKVCEWCEDFDGDLDKITKKLTSDTFNREFLMHVGHRAVLHIIPLEGDPINAGKNEIGLPDADWGWVSQCQGYGKDQEINTEVANDKPTARRFWGGRKVENAVLGPDGKPIHDVGTKASVPPVEQKSEQKYPADSKKAGNKDGQTPRIVANPPAWAKSNDDVKLWYDIVGGKVHDQWKKRLPIIVVDFEAVKISDLHSFKTYAMNKKLKTTGTMPQTSSGKPPEDLKLISGVAGDKELPIIGAKELEKVLDYVAKHLDGNSKGIIPPTEMQAIEKALPNFATAIGMKPEETINWPVGFLKGIGTTDIMALVLYAIMWRSIARPYVQVSHTVGATTVTTKLGDNTTKVESHILAKDELKPSKKTFWGGGKKVA